MDLASIPLFDRGQLRKRWRYVAVFAEELMLCAARAEVGPLTQSFWILWDRERRQQWAHTNPLPGSREVVFDEPRLAIDGPGLRASLELGDVTPIEASCPSGKSLAWTRKRAGMPVEGTVEIPGRRWQIAGRGIDDESAGHHQRHTHWRWSAGVGESVEGRSLAWNLVEGINDPPQGSERAIWVDGEPAEPAPVSFRGLDAIDLGDAGSLDFATESRHSHDDNYLLIRSRYRHRFGSFGGTLGGLTLANGLGVMEEHDALW
ncbi:MAG TPA: DUF2804 family protein [Solirubrobacterales bacterium]|jgi:hypothetical protein|nr:DUF2804 family protein [Solirubrobacterales bacterium]